MELVFACVVVLLELIMAAFIIVWILMEWREEKLRKVMEENRRALKPERIMDDYLRGNRA